MNRTTPKTQSAMLEAMAEHQVTVEGNSFPLPLPFHVIATRRTPSSTRGRTRFPMRN